MEGVNVSLVGNGLCSPHMAVHVHLVTLSGSLSVYPPPLISSALQESHMALLGEFIGRAVRACVPCQALYGKICV